MELKDALGILISFVFAFVIGYSFGCDSKMKEVSRQIESIKMTMNTNTEWLHNKTFNQVNRLIDIFIEEGDK